MWFIPKLNLTWSNSTIWWLCCTYGELMHRNKCPIEKYKQLNSCTSIKAFNLVNWALSQRYWQRRRGILLRTIWHFNYIQLIDLYWFSDRLLCLCFDKKKSSISCQVWTVRCNQYGWQQKWFLHITTTTNK